MGNNIEDIFSHSRRVAQWLVANSVLTHAAHAKYLCTPVKR